MGCFISVIALFKKLGAPKDLTLLVEGESLFNDATAITLTKLILAALLTGVGIGDAMLSGLFNFIVIVVGGMTLGGLLGIAFAWIAGRVDDEPFVEITLTLVLAYVTIVSYQYRAGGAVLHLLAPGLSLEHATIIAAVFVILYTALAGMISVAYTDVVNGLLIGMVDPEPEPRPEGCSA